MKHIQKYWRLYIIFLFGILISSGISFLLQEQPTKYMTVRFLSVGQGDAIYIESPTHNRMIIDGGPQHSLMPALNKFLPWYVRSIDVIMVTNPDADHYAGFLDMLPTFHVDDVIEPGTISTTPTYASFEALVKKENIPEVLARRGQIIHLGGGADLRIIFPDKDVSDLSTNDGSIIAQLTYGSTSVMFTGDAPIKTEEYALSIEGTSSMKSTLLKVGHHGSRTSASYPFTEAVDPEDAIISDGLNNKYGFPHKETVDLFNSLHIPMLITSEKGTITAISDGKTFTITTEK